MKLKQISVSIENAHQRLYEITDALGQAGINLRALNLVDSGDFGLLRLLVSDVPAARRIMMKMQMPARIDDVVAIEIKDHPGSFAALLKDLFSDYVKVKYIYALTEFTPDCAVMIFHFDDNDRAIEILQKKKIKILDAKYFGIKK